MEKLAQTLKILNELTQAELELVVRASRWLMDEPGAVSANVTLPSGRAIVVDRHGLITEAR